MIAITAILTAHGLLVAYLYRSTFEPRYEQPVDPPPVTATIVHPEVPPPPPPPPSQRSKIAPPAHPRAAALLSDVKPPEQSPLPPMEKPPVADPKPQPDFQPRTSDVQSRILTNPQFDRRPNADDLAQYYPERADRLGKEGAATIRCTVSAKGALIGCVVLSEDPTAFGFGDAALKLAKVFKLKPATADGAPVDGGVFTTKITFKLPE